MTTVVNHAPSLHDALPISGAGREGKAGRALGRARAHRRAGLEEGHVEQAVELTASLHAADQADLLEQIRLVGRDRKSTRLNSSHLVISYAVFCLKKKNKVK